MKLHKIFCFVFTIYLSTTFPTAAQTVVTTIPVGTAPDWATVDRLTNLIYVVNVGDSTVSVIDGSTNTVVATDPVANFPQAATVNSSLNRIYVGDFGSANQLSIINGRTNQVIQRAISKSSVVTGIAANSATGSVYMCNTPNTIVVFDGHTNKVISTLNVPQCTFGIGVNRKTNLIYVGTFTPNITVIDGSTNTVVNTFPIDLTGIVTVTADSVSNHLGVVDTNAGKFEVLDAATGTLLGTVSGLQRPFGAVFVPGAKFAMVTEESANDIVLIDATNFSIISHTPVGTFPLAMDFDPSTHLAYVANDMDNSVTVISIP